VPPFFVHLDLDIMLTPIPLQAFLPLQAFAAVLHAPWPLQALTPVQATFFDASASVTTVIEPTANMAAAARASEAPDRFASFINDFLSLITMPCGAV
jgi:hypothetical protein